jgi:hypothetical protein
MNVRTLVLSLLLSGSLFGCATATKDIRVETESAPGVNLSGYTTYAWAGSAEVVNDPHGNWEPPGFDADAELRFLINRELRGKGMQEVTSRHQYGSFRNQHSIRKRNVHTHECPKRRPGCCHD